MVVLIGQPQMTNLPSLQIGPVALATNLLLAPIAGYCDLAFRLVARSCGGLGMVCTDLLCPEGVLRENRRSMELAMTTPEDSPLCMQLYGGNVELLKRLGARYQASILEVVDQQLPDHRIETIESWWKTKLMTREHGLNSN